MSEKREDGVSLKNPPLVEIWMAFGLEPAPGARPWKRERYRLFLDVVAEKYPNNSELVRRGVGIFNTRPGAMPKIKQVIEDVIAVRAVTADELRGVQLHANQLATFFLRTNNQPYPGFEVVLAEAMENCRHYANCYHPIGVREAALCYVDLVDLPIPETGIIMLEDFLTLDVKVPDAFGPFQAFEVKAIVHPSGSPDPVELRFLTMPNADPTVKTRQFRLEWKTSVRTADIMAVEDVPASMRIAHNRLLTCFRQAFTPKGWSLFEPE